MSKKNIILIIIIIAGLIGCIIILSNRFIGNSSNSNNTSTDKMKNTNTTLLEKIDNIEVNDKKVFEGLTNLNDNTLETILGINRNFVEEHAISLNLYTYEDRLYMVIKPKKDNKETVKKSMDNYIEFAIENTDGDIKTKYEDALKEEYNGYYIYVVSDSNEEIFNKIKNIIK